jgi:glycosyltransferase involved in cell wall biosynthesis
MSTLQLAENRRFCFIELTVFDAIDARRDTGMLTISVLICTWQRAFDLRRCLVALDKQTRLADEIILVARQDDHETLDMLAEFKGNSIVRVLRVSAPGTVIARNAGLDELRTDLVAMIDDDTAPHPCWLQRIERHFLANERLGGLGGRDRCVNDLDCDRARMTTVGRLQFCGRPIGNHHAGFGAAREVDLLKGANMSFRSKAIAGLRFDSRLRGEGAQPHEDLAFSMAVRHAGWQLIYDPEVLVDHFEGPREEPRHYAAMLPITDGQAYSDVTYNYVIAIHDKLSYFRRATYVLWQLLVGTPVSPGVVQAVRFTPTLGRSSWQRFWITQKAVASAYLDLWKATSHFSRVDASRRVSTVL